VRLSRAAIRTADAIEGSLDGLSENDLAIMETTIADHLPEILLATAGDRLEERMPPAYRRWLIAKSLAARIVYREGLEAVEAVESDSIPALAVEFLRREQQRNHLADEVDASAVDHAADIASLLRTTPILSTIPCNTDSEEA